MVIVMKISQALKILTQEQINFIKQRLDIGGKNDYYGRTYSTTVPRSDGGGTFLMNLMIFLKSERR